MQFSRNARVLTPDGLGPLSPSPDQRGTLATLSSTGEIPIFLHPSCEQDNMLRDGPRFLGSSGFLKLSSSASTFQSTNTFGMSVPSQERHQESIKYGPLPHDNHYDMTSERLPLRPRQEIHHPDSARLSFRSSQSGSYWSNRFSTIADLSHLAVSACQGSLGESSSTPISLDSGYLRPSPSVPHSVTASDSVPFSLLSASESVVIAPIQDHLYAAYPTYHVLDAFKFPSSSATGTAGLPRLATVPSGSCSVRSNTFCEGRSRSPAPSTSTTASHESVAAPTIRYRSPLLRHEFRSQNASSQPDHASVQAACGSSPSQRRPPSSSYSQSVPASPVMSQFSDAYSANNVSVTHSLSESSESSRSSYVGPSHSPAPRPKRGLSEVPPTLNWLHDICFQLWIDQEGSRAIRPTFRLVGFNPSSGTSLFPTSGSELWADTTHPLTHGLALFRPMLQVTSVYHHGTLDTPSVLGRLTLADREDKYYIFRQPRSRSRSTTPTLSLARNRLRSLAFTWCCT